MTEEDFRSRVENVIRTVDSEMRDERVDDMFVNFMTLLADVQRETGEPVNVEAWGW